MKYFFGLPIHIINIIIIIIIIIPVSCWMMIQFSIIGDCQNINPGCFLGRWWLALLIQDDKIWQAVATLSVETCFHPRRVNHKGLPSGFHGKHFMETEGKHGNMASPMPIAGTLSKSRNLWVVNCPIMSHLGTVAGNLWSWYILVAWSLHLLIYCTTYWDQWPLSCRQYVGVGKISVIIWKLMI